MFVVKIQGGLGNQLFQYAFGQYLEKTHPQKQVVYDVCVLKNQSQRKFLLQKLLSCKVRTIDSSQFLWERKLKKFSTFQEVKHFTFDKKIQNIKNNTIFDGYFQHYKYVDPIKEELRKSIRNFRFVHKYHTLRQKHSLIALHIRRGDYIADEKIGALHGHCSLAYYMQALEEMHKKVKNPYVLIFSDDIAWVKENLKIDIPHMYEENNHPYLSTINSFTLMRFCDHFIIANSSFSWFSAFLGIKKESQIITPYFFNFRHNVRTKQFSPPKWKALAHHFATVKPKTPKVSIIIPVYNVEKYLSRCLESVCNQSLQNIEIIVVNDCSPDNSEKIIHEYQKRDARIQYLKHKKNLYLGGARNSGIRQAKADWILFVDSDDWIHRDMALTMYKKAQQYKVKVVQCGMTGIQEKTGTTYFYTKPLLEDVIIKKPFFHYCYKKKPTIESIVCTKLWHRSLFTKKNISFPHYVFYEDAITVPHLLKEVNTLVLIPHYFYFYLTDRNTSIMNKSVPQILSSVIPAFTRCLMENKKKFSKENSKTQKAYEYFLEVNAVFQYSFFMRQASKTEEAALLKTFITHYGEYGIRAVGEFTRNKIQEFSENRWYKFGQLSKKEKMKFLLECGMKKLLQKIKNKLRQSFKNNKKLV